MKTYLTNDLLPALVPVLRAANEDAVRESAQPGARVAAGWDPHEVWRTRILPYQRQLRARAEAVAER